MTITVFTSNQTRHIHLIEQLSQVANQVFAVQECTTLFPGEIDDFYKKSEVMQKYFSKVIEAERAVFGTTHFLSENVHQLAMKAGDVSKVHRTVLEPALHSDYYIIFGASYIRGWLCDFLVEQKAINIHMGISPYYRGNSCNFWALYDHKPDMVGATIHYLSKGLDSGSMLFHALPKVEEVDSFILGMKAVKAAHQGLIQAIKENEINTMTPKVQEKDKLIRYTKNADFTNEVAEQYLNQPMSAKDIKLGLKARDTSLFLNPFIEITNSSN